MIFSDKTNYASQLLLAHFFLLDCIMGEIIIPVDSVSVDRKLIARDWIEKIADSLPAPYKQYIEWPLRCMTQIDQGSLLDIGSELTELAQEA